MKNSLYILHIITGLSDGGAEAVLNRLCTYDRSNCHQVVSLMDAGKYGDLLKQADITVHCLNMPRGRIKLTGLFRLWSLLRNDRPDVVQTWMYHADLVGGVVARLAGIRSVCWGIRQSNLEPGNCRASTILIARLCAALSRLVPRRIICCAHSAAQAHQRLGYVADKFRVVPNGYLIDQFVPDMMARDRLRADWDVGSSMPLLGMVARFDPQKDHENLISSLALLKDMGHTFQCLLVGQGLTQDNVQLVSWLKDMDLQNEVILLGQRNDVPAVMNALDVHVLSSLGEAFPNVLAEAMASGTPCVTTDVGDAAVIVGDTGWVAPPKNPKALAQAISEALDAMRACSKWSDRQQAARKRIIEHFSLDRMVQAYSLVWEETIAPSNSKSL